MSSDLRQRAALVTPFRSVAMLALFLTFVVPFAACKSGSGTDPILRLSAQEALERGQELMEDEKYYRAREYLIHAYEVEPNSLAGREALLLAADSFYEEGGRSEFVQAEARYRDFINRFPTSDKAAYAQFQIANSLAQRMGRPDRDLSSTSEALEAYQDLIRLYPTSEYAAQARDKIQVVEENLAEHELLVGDFYLSYGLPSAAVSRFEYLIDNYPGYRDMEKVIYKLGVAYVRTQQSEKAQETYDRLAREFPESGYLDEFPEIPEPRSEPEESQRAAGDDGEDGERDAAESDSEGARP